jgi:Integrase
MNMQYQQQPTTTLKGGIADALFSQAELARPTRTHRPAESVRSSKSRASGPRVFEVSSDIALRVPAGKVQIAKLDSYDWKRQLADFLQTYGRIRSNNFKKPAGEVTLQNRRDILFKYIGYLIQEKKCACLGHVKPRHLHTLFAHWDELGISKRTQINYFNHFGWMWRICGLDVQPIAYYARYEGEFTINRNATTDKSWSGNKVSFEEIHAKIAEHDPIAGRIVLAMKTYGLRVKEALCLKPHESDAGEALLITRGTKTGRARQLEFSEFEDVNFRAVLNDLKDAVPEKNHLAWINLSLKQGIRRMHHYFEKHGLTKAQLGVTGHGLRHQFAIEQLESLTGQIAPVRGGIVLNYKALSEARRKVSRAMGHNRPKITGAYYGSFMSLERDQLRNFKRAWGRIEYPLKKVGAILEKQGIENLYWVGSLSKGARTNDIYEFVFPMGVEPEKAVEVGREISELVMSATGDDCIVVPWESLPEAKAMIWEHEAIPLFKAVSPLEFMQKALQEQRVSRLSAAKGFARDDADNGKSH